MYRFKSFALKKITIDPVCFILWVWLFLVLGVVVAVNYFLAILAHEAGHYFVAKKLGYKLSRFSFSPYGVSLSYFNQDLEISDELKVAFAGPLANFVTALCMISLWWVFPTTYFFTESFVYLSIILALLNLLPAYPLDGARMFICASANFFGEKLAKRITLILNIFLAIFFLVLFCVFCFLNFNPTYLLFAVFLIGGVLDLKQSSKYEKINIFSKKTKNFSKPEYFVVDENVSLNEILKKINPHKTTIFSLILENGKILNLSEKFIIELSFNYSINLSLKEILKNLNKKQ